MKNEMTISPVILAFDDLDEILATIDEEIELHRKLLARYGDRLGVLLRNTDSAQSLKLAADQERSEPDRNTQRNKKRETEDGGWMSLETEEYTLKVATLRPDSPPATFEVAQLFKITEALKSKVGSLELAKRFLNELPSRGYRADQRFLVVFKEGIPRHVIPTNESREQVRRFRYSDQFELASLE